MTTLNQAHRREVSHPTQCECCEGRMRKHARLVPPGDCKDGRSHIFCFKHSCSYAYALTLKDGPETAALLSAARDAYEKRKDLLDRSGGTRTVGQIFRAWCLRTGSVVHGADYAPVRTRPHRAHTSRLARR